MKFFTALIGLLIVGIVAGFIYLSVADVSVEQTTMTKPIPLTVR